MTMKRSGMDCKLERLVGYLRLRRAANRHGFPMTIKNKYIYGCYCWMGQPAFHAWRDYMSGLGIKDADLAPLRGDGDVIATYRCVRSYRNGYRGSDYAAGDSGNRGDFKLARIDRLPNSATCGKSLASPCSAFFTDPVECAARGIGIDRETLVKDMVGVSYKPNSAICDDKPERAEGKTRNEYGVAE